MINPRVALTSSVAVAHTLIVVLPEGKTQGERNHNKGHLFERFIALLMEHYGYETPTRRNLTVSSNGIELDVVTRHKLTKQTAIAECKAYTTNVDAHELTGFYGKLVAERFQNNDLVGYFVAIPGLTTRADEFYRTVSASDKQFHYLNPEEIVNMLIQKAIVRPPPNDELASDLAVVITSHGTYCANKLLDPVSRRAASVQVWGVDCVPTPVIELLTASDYASGLPVATLNADEPRPTAFFIPAEPTIVEVSGSKSELEYQLPASPKFFVGRREHVKEFKALFTAGIGTGTVIVLNGQSGWGKSSLALRFKRQVIQQGGQGVVIDSRTAASPEFVWQSLRKALSVAERHGIAKLPSSSSYASLNSIVATIANTTWLGKPLLIFFDQFENVFRDFRLTREFRDLALAIKEVAAPIIIGFAWKTDLVGLTETYPYQLRDDIRSCAAVYLMDPLGPKEISALLRRLQNAAGTKLQKDLKQRLREVSQGLPWLFKKLASHIDRELKSGVTQDDLVTDTLNVKRLFDTDIAELGLPEREALRRFARLAPRAASEVVELIPKEIVQSLVDRRLIVRVGDLLDTYWDIFRDFLITGEVVVSESYILRQTPFAVAKLLTEVINAGGDLLVQDAVRRLGMAEGAVFNLSRELRVMGVVTDLPRHIHIAEDIFTAADRETAIRERISASLKKHKAVSMLTEMAASVDGPLPMATFAEALPKAFPAIQASSDVWRTYARVFVNWLEYAQLATHDRGGIEIPPTEPKIITLLTSTRHTRSGATGRPKTFPQSQPKPALLVADAIARSKSLPVMRYNAKKKALGDLLVLDLIEMPTTGVYVLKNSPFDQERNIQPHIILQAMQQLSGPREAIELLKKNPLATNTEIGQVLQTAYNTIWKEQTLLLNGKTFRAWAKLAGVIPRRRRKKNARFLSPTLWKDELES